VSGFDVAGRRYLVCGVANKKSVGFHVGERLVAEGASVAWSVRTEARRDQLAAKLPGGGPVFVCDVAVEGAIERLAEDVARDLGTLHGVVHSIAHAEYSGGAQPFQRTARADFLRAVDVSCFSFVRLAGALEPHLERDASLVAISISTTRMAAENYGYMAPVKAALDSAVVFLAKSLAAKGEIRVNAVKAGLLKTASSAGIPGYLESWLYAERAIPRKRGLETREAADVALFLLSPRSSGINGQGLVVDAGLEWNHFDREIVERVNREDRS
jgi:enoyl-[acyl-carrier protein] reductase I